MRMRIRTRNSGYNLVVVPKPRIAPHVNANHSQLRAQLDQTPLFSFRAKSRF